MQRHEKKSRCDVHDRADVLHALGDLDPHRPLDAHAQRVAVLRGAEVVEPVREREGLRIGQLLAHLLDAAVDVAAVYVELADDLALERDAEAQHAVRGRVLGTDVDDVLALVEDRRALADVAAVGQQLVARRIVARDLVAHAQGVQRRVVVLAQGVSHPVVAQVEAPHVGMVQEPDAEVVEDLAFVELRGAPHVADRRQHGPLAVGRHRAQDDVLARGGGFDMVDGAEALLAPVHAREAAQEVESLGMQPLGQRVQPLGRHGEVSVALLARDGRGFPGRHSLFQRIIHVCQLFPRSNRSFRPSGRAASARRTPSRRSAG